MEPNSALTLSSSSKMKPSGGVEGKFGFFLSLFIDVNVNVNASMSCFTFENIQLSTAYSLSSFLGSSCGTSDLETALKE
jgi:hypothetical protein